jgi:hypothetical protein
MPDLVSQKELAIERLNRKKLETAQNASTAAHIADKANPHEVTATQASAIPSSYIDTDGALTANSDVKVPSQKAVKTYVDGTVADWTPSPANLNVGTTGAVVAKHLATANTERIHFEATLGGTGISVGDVSFTLPAASLFEKRLTGEALDATGNRHPIIGIVAASSTTCTLRAFNSAGTYLVSNVAFTSSVPFTWAAGDKIMIDDEYIK